MKKLVLTLGVALALSATLYAQSAPSRVPAKRDPVEITLPDSTTLTIKLVGDEWKHWTMTIDGYLIKQNDKGFYYYLVKNCRGEQVMSNRRAKNPEDRSKCDLKFLAKKGLKK